MDTRRRIRQIYLYFFKGKKREILGSFSSFSSIADGGLSPVIKRRMDKRKSFLQKANIGNRKSISLNV